MSRVGKLPIAIPNGVSVQIKSNSVSVKGPKGELKFNFHTYVRVESEDGQIKVIPKSENKQSKSLHGLTRTLIANMVEGVTNGYMKNLEIVGIGYKVSVSGRILTLNVGYSHPVLYQIPEDIDITTDKKNNISIKGIDKQKVGQIAAEIRSVRPPEPYKGKGIRYEREQVRRKVGKTGA